MLVPPAEVPAPDAAPQEEPPAPEPDAAQEGHQPSEQPDAAPQEGDQAPMDIDSEDKPEPPPDTQPVKGRTLTLCQPVAAEIPVAPEVVSAVWELATEAFKGYLLDKSDGGERVDAIMEHKTLEKIPCADLQAVLRVILAHEPELLAKVDNWESDQEPEPKPRVPTLPKGMRIDEAHIQVQFFAMVGSAKTFHAATLSSGADITSVAAQFIRDGIFSKLWRSKTPATPADCIFHGEGDIPLAPDHVLDYSQNYRFSWRNKKERKASAASDAPSKRPRASAGSDAPAKKTRTSTASRAPSTPGAPSTPAPATSTKRRFSSAVESVRTTGCFPSDLNLAEIQKECYKMSSRLTTIRKKGDPDADEIETLLGKMYEARTKHLERAGMDIQAEASTRVHQNRAQLREAWSRVERAFCESERTATEMAEYAQEFYNRANKK